MPQKGRKHMKKRSIEEILRSYTAGEYPTLEAVNKDLKAAGSDVLLDPQKNVLTPEERAVTKVGETPASANGYGLMSSGTGTLDKVRITGGVLTTGGNEILENGKVNMDLTVYIGGKRYSVRGRQLAEGRTGGE